MRGANPLKVHPGLSAIDAAKISIEQEEQEDDGTGELIAEAKAILKEIECYLENPIRYRSDCSALIALAIGMASLDLPVLIATLISEYLVSINEEKLFGQYSEQKSWDIAALIKKKAQIEN